MKTLSIKTRISGLVAAAIIAAEIRPEEARIVNICAATLAGTATLFALIGATEEEEEEATFIQAAAKGIGAALGAKTGTIVALAATGAAMGVVRALSGLDPMTIPTKALIRLVVGATSCVISAAIGANLAEKMEIAFRERPLEARRFDIISFVKYGSKMAQWTGF